MREPWERLPEETDKAWLAFGRYLDAGPGRSLISGEKQQNRSKQQKPKKLNSSTFNWSVKFRWKERAAAWDARLMRQEMDLRMAESARRIREVEARRKQVDEEAFISAGALLIKAHEMLALPVTPQAVKGPDGETRVVEAATPTVFRTAAYLIRVAEDLRRTSVGLASRFSASGRLPDDAAARVAGAAVPPPEDRPEPGIDTTGVPPELAEQIRAVVARWAAERMGGEPG